MRSALAISALMLCASAAVAQQPPAGQPQSPRPRMGQPGSGQRMGQPGMGQPGMAMGTMGARPRMRPNLPPARAVLALRRQLALTDDQVKKLEALASAQGTSLRPDRAAQLRARADFIDAQQKDNLDAERAALDKMARLRTDAVMARLTARKNVKDVLTPDQREKLQARFARGIARRRGAQRRGRVGVPGGPMGQRGFGGGVPGGPPRP